MWNKPIPVIVHYSGINTNLVFDSATECAEFFTNMGNVLYAEQVKRFIRNGKSWTFTQGGQVYEVQFDKLLTPENLREV